MGDVISVEAPRKGVGQDVGPAGIRNHYGFIVHVSAEPRVKPDTYIGPRYFYFLFGADGGFGEITEAWVRGYAAYVK